MRPVLSLLKLLFKPWWLYLFTPRMFAPAFLAVGIDIPRDILTNLGLLTILGCATISALDDYLDREVDRQEDPSRPIPSGEVSPREALAAAGIVCVLGAYVAWMISFVTLVLAGAIATLFILSATVLRKTPLTILSIPVTISIVLLLSYTAVAPPDRTILLLLLIFLVWDIGHDTAETLSDPWSALRMDRGTIPFLLGTERASMVILGSVALTLLLSAVLGIIADLHLLYYGALFVGSLKYVASALILSRDLSKEQAQKTFMAITQFQTVQLVGIVLDRFLFTPR